MTRARVRAHQRKDGSRVRAHDRQTPQPGERRSVDPDAAAAAAAIESVDDGWAAEPVTLEGLRSSLQALGCGKKADNAPLVHLARDEHGLTMTAALSTTREGAAAAFELVDPFAGGDVTESTVNGRHLLDSLKARPIGERRSLTAADIGIDMHGQVTIAGGNLGNEAAAAAERLAEADALWTAASAAGVTAASVKAEHHAALEADLAVWDSEQFREKFAEAYAAAVACAIVPRSGYSSWRAEANRERTFQNRLRDLAGSNPDVAQMLDTVGVKWSMKNGDVAWLKHSYDKTAGSMADHCRDRADDVLGNRIDERRERFETEYDEPWSTARAVAAWGEGNGWDRREAWELAMRRKNDSDGPYAAKAQHLRQARELLDALGSPAAEQVTAALFAEETAAVAQALSTDAARPVLGLVHFAPHSGQPAMVATDSYTLHMSHIGVPRSLSDSETGIGGSELRAWAAAVRQHVGSASDGAQIAVSSGSVTETIPTSGMERRRGEGDTKEQDVPLVGLHAGQTRTAMRASTPSYPPEFASLIDETAPRVTVDVGTLRDAARTTGRKAHDNPGFLDLRVRTADGSTADLQWRRRSLDSERDWQVDDSGSLPLTGDVAAAQGEHRANARFLGNALAFVHRSGDTAEIGGIGARGASGLLKPMRISAAGDDTRLALTMPIDVSRDRGNAPDWPEAA